MSLFWGKKVEADKITYTESKAKKRCMMLCALAGFFIFAVLYLYVNAGYFMQLSDHPYIFLALALLGFFLIGVSVLPRAIIQFSLMSAQRNNKKTYVASTPEGERIEIER